MVIKKILQSLSCQPRVLRARWHPENRRKAGCHLARRTRGWHDRLVWVLLCFCLTACSGEPQIEGGSLKTIEANSFSNTLYYSGTILPMKTVVVPSPADGAVVEMLFQYGQIVKEGQALFLISSAKFLTDYKAALLQYLKAKNDFNIGQTQLKEAEFLHKNELISDDDYKSKKSNFYSAHLTLLQAKDALENLLKQLDLKDLNPYNLTIADIDKITQAMRQQMNSDLRVVSPATGIILSPTKNEEDTKKIAKGDVVKQGDVLGVIGDMNGLSVRIKVNELTVNQLKVGQKVKVSGIAFPEHFLNGEIKRIDWQGEGANGGLPTFPVEIVVPKLSQQQQKDIHVGMSAKVEINIEETPQIVIPIVAIKEKLGESFVQIYDAKEKKIKSTMIKTGKTTMDSVAVLDGLKPGDRIVIPS